MPTSIRRQHRFAGLTPEERQAQRRALLLDAGFDLLGAEGWDATTVRAIVERAQLNPRYFYESFTDIDELVIAVYDRVVDELAHEVLAGLETMPAADPAAQGREVVRRIVEFVDADRRRGHVLYVEGLGSEVLNRRRIEAGRAVIASFEQFDAQPFTHLQRAAAAIGVGGLSQLLRDWIAGAIDITRDQLIDDASMLLLAVVKASGRA
ncbi:MAG TPA: helix-turn-helix domain-containing protein [Acidimicrobiales bacterium]|nr:helix-turn-helix domain-containing protein [Acidimicrobiales bacterium]